MPGHYGDKKKKTTPNKKMGKGLAALKKPSKVAAAITRNKRKR